MRLIILYSCFVRINKYKRHTTTKNINGWLSGAAKYTAIYQLILG